MTLATAPSVPGTKDCGPGTGKPCPCGCPEFKVQFGMLCFLVGEQCDSSGRVCQYHCIRYPWQPPVVW